MITAPIYIFLFIYLFFLLIFAIFSIINVMHMFHTGALTFASFTVTIIIGIIALVVLYGTWFSLQNVDWQQTITIFDKAWFDFNGLNNPF